ncbi:MAG: hypothetical protein ACFFDT_34140 [Candidatus Hodarchaeota archaeon]
MRSLYPSLYSSDVVNPAFYDTFTRFWIVKVFGIISIILLLLAGGIFLSWFINASLNTETFEIEVTTEDTLPVNHKWVELPKDNYKIGIFIKFQPYNHYSLFSERNYGFVYPEGVNFANFSIMINNTPLTS